MAQTAQPADITAVTNILKKVYTSDKIGSQLNEETILFSRLEQVTDYHDGVGDKAVLFVKTGRNVGTSARSLNGGTLGAAGHQQTAQLQVDYTAEYIQCKILGTTIAKMKTARQSAVRAIALEADGAIGDVSKDIQRMLYGNGDALIAACGTTTASATVTLSNAVAGYDAIVRGWLQPGMYVDIGTAANSVLRGQDLQILSVNASATAPTITLTSAVTTAVGDFISKAGNRVNTMSYEMNGLQNITAAGGALHGLTDSSWVGNVTAVTGVLSRSNMQSAWRAQRQYGGKVNLIVTSLEQADDFQNTLTSQVRFTSVDKVKDSSLDGPEFNGVPVLGDPDCPRGVMYFLDTTELFMVSAGKPDWANNSTNGDILMPVQGEDAFTARAVYYGNLATTKRRAHAAITGIVQPA